MLLPPTHDFLLLQGGDEQEEGDKVGGVVKGQSKNEGHRAGKPPLDGHSCRLSAN